MEHGGGVGDLVVVIPEEDIDKGQWGWLIRADMGGGRRIWG